MARIVTHQGCMDGYCSAHVFKKWLAPLLNITITEVVYAQPRDVGEDLFAFEESDVVVDLPKPKKKVAFWVDHHKTNEPENQEENEVWRSTPSCASLLIDVAKEKGAVVPQSVEEFKKIIDIIDDARYSEEDVKECFYPADFANPSLLLKAHMVKALFTTKDHFLNDVILREIFEKDLGDTPLDNIDYLHPTLYHEAQINAHELWRETVDTFMEYDESSQCVMQDNRKGKTKGKADHFYACMKYPQSSYNLLVKPLDETSTLIRIGSNIFHKERCNIDIGNLCKRVGSKFGQGSGGGHFGVGGTTINAENTDEAVAFILEELKKSLSV